MTVTLFKIAAAEQPLLLGSVAVDRYLPPTAANPPHVAAAARDWTDRRRGGRTDGHRDVT